jgi:hypothetical protein
MEVDRPESDSCKPVGLRNAEAVGLSAIVRARFKEQ